MNSFKDNILQLLSDTGYVLKLKTDKLSFVESPFTIWFNQNISQENCITEEELTEFRALEENGEVLFGEELEEALQGYNDAGAGVPIDKELEDIRRDELEHAQHQLGLQKQLVSALRSSLYSLENDNGDLQQNYKKAETQKVNVLKNLLAASNEFDSKLNQLEGTLNGLVEDITVLAPSQELSADEGIYTYSSEKFKSSTLSNSSSLSTVSSFSTNKVLNNHYLCQMPLDKFNKQNITFCKIVKDLLLKRLSKIQLEGSRPHAQLLVQNIMDRLFRQKLMYIKLAAELEGTNNARNRIKDTFREIQCQMWKPTQSLLRSKTTELEESSILNETETSLVKDEEELSEVCKEWANLQVLMPICDRLREKITWGQFMLAKLNELASIMSVKLAINVQLCEKMEMEYELVVNIMDLYNNVHNWVELRLEATRTRLRVMKENLQDYNDHCVEARRELVECLATSLGCDNTEIPNAYSLLTEQSRDQHEEFVHSCRQQLQTLASVQQQLKDFYCEEEEKKLGRAHIPSNQDHWDSIRETLEHINCDIEDAKIICYTMLENKEKMASY